MIALCVLHRVRGLFGCRIGRLGRSCIWLRTAQNFRFYMLLVIILAGVAIGNGGSLSLRVPGHARKSGTSYRLLLAMVNLCPWGQRVGTRSGVERMWGPCACPPGGSRR